VVTWRRAQMILLSAQGMPVPRIAEVTFTSADRVRDVIHNFNLDGFNALYPRYRAGRPPTFTLAQRRQRGPGCGHLAGRQRQLEAQGRYHQVGAAIRGADARRGECTIRPDLAPVGALGQVAYLATELE
jgi:hypothetical protein